MNPDFDAIKKTTDLLQVIQSYSIALKKQGKDYIGLCPFHDDTRPSPASLLTKDSSAV
jgi:DNA primase